MKHIGIFSLETDLHAHAVLSALKDFSNLSAHFIASDAQVENGGVIWRSSAYSGSKLKSYTGNWVNISDLDVIWWRRVNQSQNNYLGIEDLSHRDLIDNEWKSTIYGITHDAFSGIWVNDPIKEAVAGNKLYQLNAASKVGLRIPKTLISTETEEILDFCKEMGGQVIVKKIMGTGLIPLATITMSYDELYKSKDALTLCPVIYQELIHGNRHVRANCFGNEVHSILINSDLLDWRRDLSVPFYPYGLDKLIEEKLIQLIRLLGLRMGIMDLMLTMDDRVVWIELNTQGQFLFGEALSGYDLTNPFADFLAKLCT